MCSSYPAGNRKRLALGVSISSGEMRVVEVYRSRTSEDCLQELNGWKVGLDGKRSSSHCQSGFFEKTTLNQED
jgi:hypothetical protein